MEKFIISAEPAILGTSKYISIDTINQILKIGDVSFEIPEGKVQYLINYISSMADEWKSK